MKQFDEKTVRHIVVLAILVLSAIMYLPSLSDSFIWDDIETIDYNGMLRIGTLRQIFCQPFASSFFAYVGPVPYYRPMCVLSWQILYKIFGLRAFYFRLFSLCVYFLCIISVWFLARRFIEEKSALFATAIFAFHPVHVENVAFVSALSDLIAGFFVIWAFWFLIKPKNSLVVLLGSFFFLLALFSKESAVALLPAVFVHDIWFSTNKFSLRQNAFKWFLIISFFLIYLLFRSNALGSETISSLDTQTLWIRVLFASYVFIRYILNLFFPVSLAPFHSEHYNDLYVSASIIYWVVCIALGVIWFNLYKKQKVAAYFSLWILMFLLPVIGIVTIYSSLWAERFAFLSSVGFSIVIGLLFSYWEKFSLFHSFFKRIIAFSYILFYFAWAMNYSFSWSNSWMLNARLIETAPDIPFGYSGMSREYAMINIVDSAYFYARKAVEVDSTYLPALVNLGTAYLMLNKDDSAAIYFRKAASVSKSEVMFYTLNAYADLISGDNYSALEKLAAAEKLFPNDARILYNTGLCYLSLGDTVKGRRYLELAWKLRPESVRSYIELKKLYKAIGDTQALMELTRTRPLIIDE